MPSGRPSVSDISDVVAELNWEPGLREDDIAVAVRDGVVTLAGFVDSWADKYRAERVASQVKGVKGIANDLEVRLPSSSERPDPEIAGSLGIGAGTVRTHIRRLYEKAGAKNQLMFAAILSSLH